MTRARQSTICRDLLRDHIQDCTQSVDCLQTDRERGRYSTQSPALGLILKVKKFIGIWLLLIGVFCLNHSTVAQSEIECPLPPDTDPVEDPEVTAQQATVDDTTLGAFTRLTRDRFKGYSLTITSASQIAYFACVLRQGEGLWRTDTVYPILMTPFGRVVFHAKDMTLSGRLIDPAILTTIYTSLGVSRQDIAGLRSTDPETFARARQSILATLAKEQDAAFDATTPIPGLRPGIPGAKGHVAVYVGRAFELPLLVFGGFDLNASHVVDEVIDYGNPSITAHGVVDRDTLKQFVIEAGNYFIDAQTGDARDGNLGSKAKVAMRDLNGPWRHGSVYVYVLDLNSNIIFFHGADPNRFEFRPLIATVRDAVTGELILPQVIAAAKGSPEGGFVRYFFDDPTDDTDSADIPKVGYAREFTGTIRRSDGSVIVSNYIVGSGFYLTDPAVVAIRQNKVVETVLPQVLRTMTASTVDAISDRIEQVSSDSSDSPSTVFNLGGGATLTKILLGKREGSLISNLLPDGSSFVLPLNASGGNGLFSNLTLWANADYRKLADENMHVMDYDGNVTSFNIGVDRAIGDDLVGGVSMTLANGTVDYTDPEEAKGEFATSLSSINPFLGWQMAENARLWAAAGMGWGEVEFTETTNSQSSDLSQTMFAGGIDLSLMSSESLFKGGITTIKMTGRTAFTSAEVDPGISLEKHSIDASQHRVSIKGQHSRELASAAVLTPSIEAGWRVDGGDGTTGNGLEIGAGLGYSMGRLMLNFNTQTLVTHSDADDLEEWSFRGMVTFHPDSDGQGLSLSLGSSRGFANRDLRVDELKANNIARLTDQQEELFSAAPVLHAKVRYDFSNPSGLGVWTSYSGSNHENQIRVMQLGLQVRPTQSFNAALQIGRHENIHRPPQLSIELEGTLRW